MEEGARLGESWVVVGLIPVVVATAVWGWRHRRGPWWLVVRLALVVYLAVLVALTLFPFPLPPWAPNPGITPWIMPIPFQTIALGIGQDWAYPAKQLLVGNIVAFVPLGIFVALTRPRSHGWRRALAIGFAISFAIEAAQLGLSLVIGYPYRQADVDDVLLNTLGTVLGYGLFRLGDLVAARIMPGAALPWR